MTPIEKATTILARTQDGRKLTSRDLALAEAAANNRLTDNGLAKLDCLYDEVVSGTYDASKLYLFGIEHLTRDSEGYMYWRGRHVEHYSHSDRDDMKRDAEALAARCLALEAKGFPVTARTAIEPIFEEAPGGTPWLEALTRFYTLFEGLGRHVAIFYRREHDDVALVERDKSTGDVTITPVSDAYTAFHHVQNQGLKSISPVLHYERFTRFFAEAGLSTNDVSMAVA